MEQSPKDKESENCLIIGLAGRIGSGKTTCAKHLVETSRAYEYNFSNPVKDITAKLFGLDRKMLDGDSEENRKVRDTSIDSLTKLVQSSPIKTLQNITGVTPRNLLQTVGTDIGRDLLYGDIWIDYASREISLLQKTIHMVVIGDVRFENEAEFVRKNGYMVHLVRLEGDVNPQADFRHGPCHKSEKGLSFPNDSQRDFVLLNGGTIEELKKNISFLVLNIKQKDSKMK